MKHYNRDYEDKLNSIKRCFFDAEHGWTTLALERLEDLQMEFPNDPEAEYAEALIRIDFFGQGIRGQECFLRAQSHAGSLAQTNHDARLSSFNSAKYARSLAEYRAQEMTARSYALSEGEIRLLDQINQSLDDGTSYAELLGQAAGEFRKNGKHGDAAAFAEIALEAGDWNSRQELTLRHTRAMSLRALDRAAEDSRNQRAEGLHPEERPALADALEELERMLVLDPCDHMLWNFKSGWLNLMNRHSDALVAADKALSLGVDGYIKPLINKALALSLLNRKDEARSCAEEARDKAAALGQEGQNDRELANQQLLRLDAPPANVDESLSKLAEHIAMSSVLVSKDETSFMKGAEPGENLTKALRARATKAGQSWTTDYINLMAQLLTYFCPQTVWVNLVSFGDINPEAYRHCLYAAVFLAADADGPMRRDACRFLIIYILGRRDPKIIRGAYREAITAVSAVGSGTFGILALLMQRELTRFNDVLVPLLCEQPPLTVAELDRAKHVTLARFTDGVSRDPKGPTPVSLKSMLQSAGKWFASLINPEPKIGEGCYRCRLAIPIKDHFMTRSTAMDQIQRGLRCRQCGRLTCYPCCHTESSCKCGAKAWSEFSYLHP